MGSERQCWETIPEGESLIGKDLLMFLFVEELNIKWHTVAENEHIVISSEEVSSDLEKYFLFLEIYPFFWG